MSPAKSSPVSRKLQLSFVLFLCIFTLFFHQKLTVYNNQVQPESPQLEVVFTPSNTEEDDTESFIETFIDLTTQSATLENSKTYTPSSTYQKVRTDINLNVSPVQQEKLLDPLPLQSDESDSVWTYRCDPMKGCIRDLRKSGETSVQIDVCWLNCGDHGALWPYPNQDKIEFGDCLISFQDSHSIDIFKRGEKFSDSTTQAILTQIQSIFLDQIQQMVTNSSSLETKNTIQIQKSPKIVISLEISSEDKKLSLETNEGYSLFVTSGEDSCSADSIPDEVNVTISAKTVFGARHALETLTQLITYDFNNKCYKIVNSVAIKDAPAFPYRGLLIDTARNFIAVPDLKRMIDAMSYNKMNMLHWHLTDSNSFAFYSKSVPQMTKYGAYSKAKVYHPKDIQHLVDYALVRGIKIIPELDAPAHAGNGWQWGSLESLGHLAVCVNAQPWRAFCGQPPCGQLNPLNNNTMSLLGKIYSDMLDVFDNDIFHMGGDEVYETCWNSDPSIRALNITFQDLWGNFQQTAYETLKKSNNMKSIRPIIWTSGLLIKAKDRKRLDPSTYIIQVWEFSSSDLITTLLKENFQLIMSPVDSMYLDQGGGTWLGRGHIYEYKNWQILYDTRITRLGAHAKQILGGEGALWSEKVNANNMDSKMWPRGAAIAERLWSSPQARSASVYSRLNHHNERMMQRGIRAEAIQPESCYRLEGHCDDPLNPI